MDNGKQKIQTADRSLKKRNLNLNLNLDLEHKGRDVSSMVAPEVLISSVLNKAPW